MDKQVRIAIYMRLSKEDRKNMESGFLKEESSSICMQRYLLLAFVQKHFKDYKVTEFQDDGYSGTNLNRPGVTRMLELVRESALDCIIVKDFSRFSRDYIELGSYIDQIFPFMGIRFISVNDDYDSDQSNGSGRIDIYFKNLLYDLYSKDLSVKVKSSLAVRKERGQYISGNCPFGYEKADDDKHMLLVEEEEAEIVRRIFAMTMEGMTSVCIAKVLNQESVKTPIEYKIEKGKTSRVPKGTDFSWSGPMVCQILQNEVYVGDMVYGKYYRDEVGGKNHIKPRSEWKIYRDHHEPIIDREQFEKIQKSRGEKRSSKGKIRHPLTGRLICGCCRKNLSLRKGRNPYFYCSSRYANPMEACVGKINVMYLEQYVLYEIYQKIQGSGEKELSFCFGISELTKEVADRFIDRIVINDEQHMEICWNER